MNTLEVAYKEIYHISDKISKIGGFNSEEKDKLYIAICYSKILEHFQAANLLLNYGYLVEAACVMRLAVETAFISRALKLDFNNAYTKLQDNLNKEINSKLDRFKTNPSYESIKDKIDYEKFEDFKKEAKETKIFKWAEIAEMRIVYDYAFWEASDYVHTNIPLLNKYLILDSENRVKSIKRPEDKEFEEIIKYTFITIIYESMTDVISMHKLSIDMNSFRKIIDQLIQELKK